jgi:multimeric flavodoxin WrbA
MMKVLSLSGSRNPNGQTARAAEAVLEGAKAVGAATELVFLPPLRIERCRQCEDSGWGICRREGRCVIDDDFARLVDEIRRADAIVFATPVYYSDLSESLRAFTDRLRRTCTHEDGQPGIKGKPAVCVCVAGGRGGGAPACCTTLDKVLATCGFDVVDAVPVRRQNLDAKQERLQLAGQWLASRAES